LRDSARRATGRPSLRRHVAGLATALLASTAGWAQQPSPIQLTSPLGLSSGYDDGLLTGTRVFRDYATIVTSPTFAYRRETRRDRFSTNYQAEFEIFSPDSELNAWNHASTTLYSHRLTPRLSVDVGDFFLSTSDSSRRLAQSQFLVPYGRYRQNSAYAGLKYRFSHRSIVFLRFENAVTTMTLPGADPGRSNQMANAGTGTFDHTVNRQHALTASYTFLHIRPLNRPAEAGASYAAVHNLSGGYAYTIREGLILRTAGGVVRGREYSYTAGGAIEKQWRQLWMMAGYQRYLAFNGGFVPQAATGATPFVNGLLADSLFQAVSVRLRGRLTRRVGVDLNGQRGTTELRGRGVRSVIAQSRVDYRWSPRLTLFAQADYYSQNLSQFSEIPLARRRFFVGLEIYLTHPPEPETAPRRRGRAPEQPVETIGDGPAPAEER